ncbi:MAG TPA: MarR family transcriptional regulator [Kiloniellaceae bacterium]|nr:MarR family transcriptional regulator [Kiloniellaceae bacterium]
MTEITEKHAKLPSAVERFILHWGDMGGQWGVNRSVAQIHALLYLSERPLPAEEIAQQLGIARSNVSTSLKELLGWRLIERVPMPGDRRDHFQAEADIWEIVTHISQVRKEREIDPAAQVLRRCLEDAEGDPRVSPLAMKRLAAMMEFIEMVDRWYGQMIRLPKTQAMTLLKMGNRIVGYLVPGEKNKAAKIRKG